MGTEIDKELTMNSMADLSDCERQLIADQLGEYYDWYLGNGGTDPEVLLSYPHTKAQRKLLLARMDDLNVVLGYLGARRSPAPTRAPSWPRRQSLSD